MIQSKTDLLHYIHTDRIANGYTNSGIRSFVYNILFPNRIVKYLYFLRKLEYYINCKTIFKYFGIIYYKIRHKNLGERLGLSVPPNTCSEGLSIPHYGNIIINHNSQIGKFCRIHSGVNIGASAGSKKAPVIGDNVYIGPGAILFGDIEIGNDNTIGANSTVNKSFVEVNVVIAGIPAKVVKTNYNNWLNFNNLKVN